MRIDWHGPILGWSACQQLPDGSGCWEERGHGQNYVLNLTRAMIQDEANPIMCALRRKAGVEGCDVDIESRCYQALLRGLAAAVDPRLWASRGNY